MRATYLANRILLYLIVSIKMKIIMLISPWLRHAKQFADLPRLVRLGKDVLVLASVWNL
jgi:hypothetical protein